MFEITNEITGNKFTITQGQTILDAGLKHGIALPYGCQKGLCGKCKGLILEGQTANPNQRHKGLEQSEFDQGYVLMCQCKVLSDMLIAIDELASSTKIESKTYPCKVMSIDYLNHDVASIKLKTPDSDSLQFLAGQYIDLHYPNFEPRSFSIASAPKTDGLIELQIRLVDGGKFTHYIFNKLIEQTLMHLEGPKGSFYLRNSDKPIIMLAGGTGFGPIKSMMESGLLLGNRQIKLYWGVQKPEDLYSLLPQQWAEDNQHIEFIPVFSKKPHPHYKRTGYVHEAVLADYPDLSNFDVYACGAPIMVKLAAQSFIKQGLDRKNFHSDAFEFQTPNKYDEH